MKTRTAIIAITLLTACIGANAQEAAKQKGGKPIVEIFTNFHSGFGSVNDDRGFELGRSYLGYEYRTGKGVTIKGVLDVGQSNDVSDYEHIAYIKNAMVGWTGGCFTINGGLIGTTQFSYQEKFWGYRYIYKSFQDQYGFGSSADLGISASWDITKWIGVDAIIANGEGYRHIQSNDGLMYGVGTTITPFRGMSFRFYAEINEGGEEYSNTINYAMFAGYKNRYLSAGIEYNIVRNYKRVKGDNLYGFSLYASGRMNSWLDIYARADGLMSNDDWNKQNDEIVILAGAQFKLGKYVKIAPNFRMTIPAADGASNRYYAYLSCCFGI
jgi:hypothetical protein